MSEQFQIQETRKLASVRRVDSIEPIEGADAIELAVVGGWKVVTKKGEFKPGDTAIYFEIDSFLPAGEPAWQFLVDKQSRVQNGVTGHRLRTIKLRGQISQGLILHPTDLVHIRKLAEGGLLNEGDNVTDVLGIVKWDPPLPAQLAGLAAGLFPSFIQKTDQERAQNLKNEIFGYDDYLTPLPDGMDEATIEVMKEKDLIKWVSEFDGGGGAWFKKMPAKARRNARYEVTMKMDGSSATFFHYNGEVGVCSRNLQLKTTDENKDNSFVRMLFDTGLNWAMEKYGNIAIQGELMGPAIQGNREWLKDFKLYVFDVQLLDEGRKMTPAERYALLKDMGQRGVDVFNKVNHSPVMTQPGVFTDHIFDLPEGDGGWTLEELGLDTMDKLLAYAEGKSLVHPVREGLVYKRVDDVFSFKTISNAYLAKEKD